MQLWFIYVNATLCMQGSLVAKELNFCRLCFIHTQVDGAMETSPDQSSTSLSLPDQWEWARVWSYGERYTFAGLASMQLALYCQLRGERSVVAGSVPPCPTKVNRHCPGMLPQTAVMQCTHCSAKVHNCSRCCLARTKSIYTACPKERRQRRKIAMCSEHMQVEM